MGQVIANASMSLDGYIAKHDNTIGRLFDWYQPGVRAHGGARACVVAGHGVLPVW